jgi:hypothetical protein
MATVQEALITQPTELDFRLDDTYSVRVEVTSEAPATKCYAMLYTSSANWKLGRFWPGESPKFASDAALPADKFREIETLRRARLVDLQKACVFRVLGMIRIYR